MDESLFLRLYTFSVENQGIGNWMVWITKASSVLFAGMYLALLLTLLIKKDLKIIPAVVGPFTAFGLVYGIRLLYHRPRPFIALDIESLIYHEASGSMPSMHAVSAFAIALAIYLTHKKFGVPAMGLALLTALSRVMVGVHFPLDILTGGILSLVVLYGTYRVFYGQNNIRRSFSIFEVFTFEVF